MSHIDRMVIADAKVVEIVNKYRVGYVAPELIKDLQALAVEIDDRAYDQGFTDGEYVESERHNE